MPLSHQLFKAFTNAQKAWLRAAIRERNSFALWAPRLNQGLLCATFFKGAAFLAMALLPTLSAQPPAKDSAVAAPQTKSPAKDTEQTSSPGQSDIPKTFTASLAGNDYVKREVMIPMRDGVKLYTVIVLPKNAKNAPILLTRTPYNAAKRVNRSESPHMLSILPQGDEVFVSDGYIRVFQDVRGKYGSQGDYMMTRPVMGPLNHSKTDHVTDAYDTIDWLVKNLPESNGRVGMIGSSYEGFTVVMALLGPHPALKVAAPESPMVDGWMGDDWFHYGAFRQTNFDYTSSQTTKTGAGGAVTRGAYDDYEAFLRAGSAGSYARANGLDKLPWDEKMMFHPAYDAFWQGQALDKLVAERPSSVPTMWIQGLWDQEDMWGAIHSYLALKTKAQADHNFLAMGPWRHSQVNYDVQPWAVEMGWRHCAAVPAGCVEAFLRSIFKDWRSQGQHTASIYLQHRRKSLGSAKQLAAGL